MPAPQLRVPLGRYRRYRRETIEDWVTDLEAATIKKTTKSPPRRLEPPGGMATKE